MEPEEVVDQDADQGMDQGMVSDEALEADGAADIGLEPDQGTDPPAEGQAAAPPVKVEAPPQPEWVAPMQAMAQTMAQQFQATLAPIVQSNQQLTGMFQQLSAQAQEQRARLSQEATRPKEPPPDADPAVWGQYHRAVADWTADRRFAAMEASQRSFAEEVSRLLKSQSEAFTGAQAEAYAQARAATYDANVRSLMASRDGAFLADPDARAVFETLYENIERANGGKPMDPVRLAAELRRVAAVIAGAPNASRAAQAPQNKLMAQRSSQAVRTTAPAVVGKASAPGGNSGDNFLKRLARLGVAPGDISGLG